jgi:aminoglycoside phosphotransferase (APT) family kinase protein
MSAPAGLDLDRLRAWLDMARPGLVRGPLRAELLPGGRSNLTYAVDDGHATWVVRRPPLGHVLTTAHDMGREFRVLSALTGTAVPVPAPLCLCADPDVLGAPFYVMARVDGTIYRDAGQVAPLGPSRLRDLAGALVGVLVEIHAIDPAEVGLGDFGRPAGYLARQLRRWSQQLDASRSRPLPGIDELRDVLAGTLPPAAGRGGIVHGDYRLDNVVVGADGDVAAVLDWEMATLGDQLTDLGLLLMYWELMLDGVDPTGFPAASWLADRYADRGGTDLTHLAWYVAFAYFKLAVIAEGIHYRYVAGQTVGAGFEQFEALVPRLVERGHAALRR